MGWIIEEDGGRTHVQTLRGDRMKTITVIAAGYSSAGLSMGDLVDEGILKKKYNWISPMLEKKLWYKP